MSSQQTLVHFHTAQHAVLTMRLTHNHRFDILNAEIKKILQRHSVRGLNDVIIISTEGFDDDVLAMEQSDILPKTHLFNTINDSLAWHNNVLT
jgi:hypothetical protein